MSARLNHARHSHRGRATERAFFQPNRNAWTAAKPASQARSLSPEAIAAWAAQNGIAVAAR